MEKIQKIFKSKNVIATIIIMIFIFVLLSVVPLVGYDDFILNYLSQNHSISLFQEMQNSIMHWNGRSTQLIAYIVGLGPRVIFFILNTIMIMLFLYFLYYFSYHNSSQDKQKSKLISTFLFILFYLFYMFQATFDVFFWMAGACNHLWSTVFNLAILIPYYNLFFGKDVLKDKKKIVFILYFILSLISGSSIEHLGVFMIPVMLIAIIYGIKKYKIKNKWSIVSLILYTIGYLYIILLPSTASRRIGSSNFYNNIDLYGLDKIKYIFQKFYVGNSIFIFITIAIFVIYFLYLLFKKKKVEKSFKVNFLLLLGSFSTLLIFYFVPYYSYRAVLWLCFFNFVCINYIVINFFSSRKVLNVLFLIFMLVANIYGYSYFYKVYSSSNKLMKYRNNNIVRQYKKDLSIITFYNAPCKYGNRVMEYKEYLYDDIAIKRYYKIDEDVEFRYQMPAIGDGYNKMCVKYNKIFNIIDDRSLEKKGLFIDNKEDEEI